MSLAQTLPGYSGTPVALKLVTALYVKLAIVCIIGAVAEMRKCENAEILGRE